MVGWGEAEYPKRLDGYPSETVPSKTKDNTTLKKALSFSWDLSTLPVEIKLQQLEEQQLTCDEVESMERRSRELWWRKKTEGGSVSEASEHLHKFWAAHL